MEPTNDNDSEFDKSGVCSNRTSRPLIILEMAIRGMRRSGAPKMSTARSTAIVLKAKILADSSSSE